MPGLFKKKPTATPSFNHTTFNKCSNPKCTYPNPRQCVEGLYQCLGTVKNRPCTGTYTVCFTPEQPSVTNKCNNPRCHYLNPGQCAEGTFDCQGTLKNKPCRGTYHVSRSQAELVDEQASKYFMEEDKRRHKTNPDFFRAQEQYMREREQEKRMLKSSMMTNYAGLTPEVRRAKQRDLPQTGLERRGARRGKTLLDEFPLPPPLPAPIRERSQKERFQKERFEKDLPPLPPPMCALPNPPRAFAKTAYYDPGPDIQVGIRYHYVKPKGGYPPYQSVVY